MKFALTHTLTFALASPSRAVEHLLLTPLNTPQQKIERWSIAMPGFDEGATFRDGFGNRAHLVSQVKPGETLLITITGAVETNDKAGVLGRLEFDLPPAVYRRPTPQTPSDPGLLSGIDPAGGRIALLHELMDRVHQRTSPSQTQDDDGQTQSLGTSIASELAHAFIGAARALDIPARYVTGYVCDEGADAAFHAWAEAWDDGLGWIGFDPLHNVCPTDGHIRLASGLDATGTMPVRMIPASPSAAVETLEITAT